jgi:hypothetical protein
MAPTVGSLNPSASKLGLDTVETNPVLLRKMHKWKQSKHKQRIMEARKGGKAASNKVGVPFARSGFAKDKLPPVESRAHRDLLDESMGDLSASLDNLQPHMPESAAGRSTPERAMQDYYDANGPMEQQQQQHRAPREPRQQQQQQQQQQQKSRTRQVRPRRRAEPAPLSERPAFDCTPLEHKEDCCSASGLKVRREVATREPPRKPKQSRALEGLGEYRPDLDDSHSTPASQGTVSSESSPEPADSGALLQAQRTIADLRKHLHAEKQNSTVRIEEAQAAARQKTAQLDAALAQTKTQLRMLQKQLQKAREEAAAAKEAAELSPTVDNNSAPAPGVVASLARRGFERVVLRPRSEQRPRDASTPPSRIPEPRSLRSPAVRAPRIEVQAPAVVPRSDGGERAEDELCIDTTPQDVALDRTADSETSVDTPSSGEAPGRLGSPEAVEMSPDLPCQQQATGEETQPAAMSTQAQAADVEAEIDDEAEDDVLEPEDATVRLERGLSTSTSCSFCVTGSPPMAVDESAVEPPEVAMDTDIDVARDLDLTTGSDNDDRQEEGAMEDTNQQQPDELAQADGGEQDQQDDAACVVELTDKALDGVARALDAIDTTAENIRTEAAGASEAEVGGGGTSADEWWHSCGPPPALTSTAGDEANARGEEETKGDDDDDLPVDEDVEELPVEIVTR